MTKNREPNVESEERAVYMVAVDVLTPYDRNARKHSDQQVQQIANSIKEFGFTNPVLIDEAGRVLAGHGRLQAAQLLGMEEVPTLVVEGLTDAQKRAYTLADNKIAENAEWDLDIVGAELRDLAGNIDLEVIGWSAEEIAKLMDGPEFVPASEDDQSKLDQKSATRCPSCGHEWVQ